MNRSCQLGPPTISRRLQGNPRCARFAPQPPVVLCGDVACKAATRSNASGRSDGHSDAESPITHSEGDGAFVFRLPGLRQQVAGRYPVPKGMQIPIITGVACQSTSPFTRVFPSLCCSEPQFLRHTRPLRLRLFPPRHLAVVGLGQAPRMRAMMLSGVSESPLPPTPGSYAVSAVIQRASSVSAACPRIPTPAAAKPASVGKPPTPTR